MSKLVAKPAVPAPAQRASPAPAQRASPTPAAPGLAEEVAPLLATLPADQYLVLGQPTNDYAFTNVVYVHSEEKRLLAKAAPEKNYVELGGTPSCVYIVEPVQPEHASKSVPRSLHMNVKQRDSCGIRGVKTAVLPKVFTLPTSVTFNIMNLRFEIDYFPPANRKFELDEKSVHEIIRKSFVGHVFTLHQELFIKVSAQIFQLKVVKMDCVKAESKENADIMATTGRGLLCLDTKLKLQVAKPREKWLTMVEVEEGGGIFNTEWKFADLGIGGLDVEFGQIFRRAFASRIFPPAVVQALGLKHVKGILLFGPPGTGKTLIARQIGKVLKGVEPKVVNGPEILNKYVGASEENIRNLFKEAEAEYEDKKEGSKLHVIIFDEIDAICKARGTLTGSTGVHDTVVNQLLSKLDGVKQLNNILVIGMTNRKDMIDPALLRPGRLEVHVEINLPDEKGRLEIFEIHTRTMRANSRLGSDVDLKHLAADTKNFSGAEIEGLVRDAASHALYAAMDFSEDKIAPKIKSEDVVVVMHDFQQALEEMTPAFGKADDELKLLVHGSMIEWGPEFSQLMSTARSWAEQLKQSESTPLLSVLLSGASGSGTTAVAAQLALDSNFPYIKVVSPQQFVGASDIRKIDAIYKVFEDAYKSPLSLVILDDIENLLDWVPIGSRFSHPVLQALLILIKRIPPKEGRKLMIVGTTSQMDVLSQLRVRQAFTLSSARVPQLSKPEHVRAVLEKVPFVTVDSSEAELIAAKCPLPIGIKQLLMLIELAKPSKASGHKLTAAMFEESVRDCGIRAARQSEEDEQNAFFAEQAAAVEKEKNDRIKEQAAQGL